ncbi:MAG: DUF2029 domain-containing protein [Oscillochloris sp.]|nr:DUF2029 domain-containing protein [Oscillochloris sp.]
MQHSRRQTPLVDLIYGVAAIIVTLVVIGVGYARAWPISITVGTNDASFVENMRATEHSTGKSFRWTGDHSRLRLPQTPFGTASILTLHMQDSRVVRPDSPQFRIRADGANVVGLTLANNVARTYYVLIPAQSRTDSRLLVDLEATTAPEYTGGRELGVALFDVAIRPTSGGPWLPSLWVALAALCLGCFGYLAARLINLRPRVALLTVAGVALLIALGLATRPTDILPFIQRFPAMAAIACLGLVLARLLAPTTQAPSGQLLVAGSQLPIYLALGAWMLLLYQVYMVWDGAQGIGAFEWDLWIGGALVVGLGLGLPIWSATGGRRFAPTERREWHTQAATVALGLGAAAHIGFSVWFAFQRQAPDFWILYKGARDWARGGSLYNLHDVMTNHFGKVFKVPPFYGMFFVPFVQTIGGEVVLFWHRVMNTVLLAGVGLAWLRMWRLPAFSPTGAALLIVLSFRPLFDTMSYGQIDLVLLFILTLTLWAMREERDLLAGALVALATLFKLYPVALLAFFVIKRQWRGLWGFALGMLVFNGISLVVMGWEMHWVYLSQVLPNIGGTTAWIENQTISGFLARIAAPPMAAAIFEGTVLRLVGTLISGLVVLGVCGLTLLPNARRSPGYALQYGLFLLIMVLCVPAAWMHYETLLVVLFGALLLHLQDRQIPVGYVATLALSFGLISYGNQWSFFSGSILGLLTWLGLSYKLYGMLLLGGLTTITLLAGRRGHRISDSA